jgi:type IV pilus assembly protein PilC
VEFRCRIASANGEVVEGVYVAETEAQLRHELEEKGLFVLSLHAKGSVGGFALQLPGRSTIPSREFLIFNQELATLLRAGMPLVQSLDLLKRRVNAPVFRTVLNDVYERVRGGAALSDAFGAHQAVIPSVYTASLVAGERSGNLETVLRRFVDYTRVIENVKRKTVSALIYPAILVVLALALVAIIVLRVVPAFQDFYQGLGAELPLVTRIIVAISSGVRGQLLLLLGVGVAALVSAGLWLRQPGNRARVDHATLGIPLAGDVARKFATSQMARTLATLLGGGLPLVNALEIAAKSVGNQYIARQLEVVGTRVREGTSFAAALEERHVFPDVAVKMAEVGESTGALQDMLNTVADFYDEEIATNMERFVTLIEPVLLVIMGIVIAALLLALYLPLFQLNAALSGS